jgi:hypothetical protein
MEFIKATILGGLLVGALIVPRGPAVADDRHDFQVPRGHMPPAGKCRIWYPGTPPGRQPAPGDCRVLSRQVPRGAWLIGHDRRWDYAELHHRGFRHEDFDRHRYLGRKEIYRDGRDVHQARKEVYQDKRDLRNSYEDLRKDRAELHKDIRSGASKQEVIQGRREVREDVKKISDAKRDLRQSQDKLQSTQTELHRDQRRR